jgi:hypothetical protein
VLVEAKKLLVLMLVIFSVESYGNSEDSVIDQALPIYHDGPYVNINNEMLTINWVCANNLATQTLAVTTLPLAINRCQMPAVIDRLDFIEPMLSFTTNENIAAISDFHGQFSLMTRILTHNHIIDQQGDWAFGAGHFVITGDVFDRGDKVTEILWFLYELEKQAELAGGKVHLLLGNHEVMILNGDLRYLHAKYVATARILKQPFEALYGQNTLLGQWLRSKAVLVKINNMLFAHGGFHPSLAKEKRTLLDINQVFKANLIKAELAEPRSGWGKYLHKGNGPIWYRGYFKDSIEDGGASAEEIDLLLNHFDIEHLVVGHTSQEQVETRYQGRVIAIDSSIKNGQYGEVLLFENGKYFRGTPDGERLPLHSGLD